MTVSIRMCLACGQQMPKEQFIRIVRNDKNLLLLDKNHTIDGRGYYVCSSDQCILNLKKKALLAAATDLNVGPSLYLEIASEYKRREKNHLTSLIEFAARSHNLVTGLQAVESHASKDKISMMIMDKTTAQNTRKSIYALYKKYRIPFYIFNEEKTLEQIIGKPNCKCIGITNRQFSRQLIHEFKQQNKQELI